MTEQREEVLAGGSMNLVVRVGDTVRRPTGPWTPTLHRLLDHLASVGFPTSRVLGVDDQGREILSFIEGRPGYRPWPPELLTDEGVELLTELVRDYHDAVAGFDPGPDAEYWLVGRAQLRDGEVVCHGDLGAYNSIWRDGRPIALIDWDFAEPGPALRDVASLAWQIVPLRHDGKWQSAGFSGEPDYRRRLTLLCEAYGSYAPAQVVEAHRAALIEARRRTTEWGSAGREPWRTFLSRGDVPIIDKDLAWLDEHKPALLTG